MRLTPLWVYVLTGLLVADAGVSSAQWYQQQSGADMSHDSVRFNGRNSGQAMIRPGMTPVPVRPLTHPTGLSKASIGSRSFYGSKGSWRLIIDSSWGPGPSLATKLAIFDTYAAALQNRFDGFLSLGLDLNTWDSLRNEVRSRIDSTTSRGAFAAIMARFASSLRDAHTWARDTVVTYTPLSPGVPLLVLGPFATVEHFGAVLTALPDSTALVLRTVPDHPLGLQPGDIVLGYEGVPWKHLVWELLDAGLPAFIGGFGARPAEVHSIIRNVGNNWHLFQTIDILKHSTGETVHLSVDPLLTLGSEPMMGNEQLEIPGIPFFYYQGWPSPAVGPCLSYGKLSGVNVGYIRLFGEWPSLAADPQFAAAVDSLWETDGLIIDQRWNSGGWSEFDAAYSRMFSERIYTMEDAYRGYPSSFNLQPYGNSQDGLIPGVPGSIYDRPIAVLLGPTCVSLGDWNAHRLRYHPMVRFFGKTSISSLGFSADVTGFAGWWLHHSLTDVFHIGQPGLYLNRVDFPVDEPVWFNADDVARGIDPILTRSLEWINSLSHMHDVGFSEPFVRPGLDSLTITAVLTNPAGHVMGGNISVRKGATVLLDSLALYNDGLHGDGLPGDSIWGVRILAPATEGFYAVDLRTEDRTLGSLRRLPAARVFTTAGPVICLGDTTDVAPAWGRTAVFRFKIANNGLASIISGVKGTVRALDTAAAIVSGGAIAVGDLGPGQSRLSSAVTVSFSQGGTDARLVSFELVLSSGGFDYWRDTTDALVTNVPFSHESEFPARYGLDQNYPNPFNPSTTIRYELPVASMVRLSIYDMLGREVTVLVNERRNPGSHEVEFDATGLSSGVYIYRLHSGDFVQSRKLIVLW